LVIPLLLPYGLLILVKVQETAEATLDDIEWDDDSELEEIAAPGGD
jgi:ubiquitin-like modifier-activating enzyme ATG7